MNGGRDQSGLYRITCIYTFLMFAFWRILQFYNTCDIVGGNGVVVQSWMISKPIMID